MKITKSHLIKIIKEEIAIARENVTLGQGDFAKTLTTHVDGDGDTIYTIPGVSLTGDIQADINMLNGDEDMANWLWGELGSDEGITDKTGNIVYWGSDVQDHLK